MTNHTAITEHYSANGNLLRQVEEFLSQSEGRSPSPVDLAALDQFHVGGLEATAALAALLAPAKGMQVLDVGSGVGGPSRYLATHYRCHVSGIDMVPVYCEVASLLAERMNLHTLVDYGVGDAVRLPFSDRSFDAVWTQRVSMNIREKREFYEGIARVLGSGGRFGTSRRRRIRGWTPAFSCTVGAKRHAKSSPDGRRNAGDHPAEWILVHCLEGGRVADVGTCASTAHARAAGLGVDGGIRSFARVEPVWRSVSVVAPGERPV